MSNPFALQTTINGRSYSMIKLGALKSIQIATLLGKTLVASSNGDADNAAMAILTSIDDVAIAKTIQDLCGNISMEGKAIDFDMHFSQYQQDLLPVLAWSLKENVMGFFAEDALKALTGVMDNLQN